MRTVSKSAVRTQAPTVLPVTLDDAKISLRVDGSALDSLIRTWIAGVVRTLEHETGQCLMEQTWEVRLDGFPAEIKLPHPARSIESVVYRDPAGASVAMAPADYGLEVGRYRSCLYPVSGTWPAVKTGRGAVVVTVKAGYGTTPDATPENAKLYILAKLADQFDPVTQSERSSRPSSFLEGLLDACRSDP